ncbi:cellulose binding domain-containing protein [Streptomyces thermocoprophilus]|uniref:Cellulose binding domain-containing protein n=1 Tax=Streptomyces thermocoprophilus TaxID=78356 RepID=A0ABV5VCI7_9ACTN
MPDLPTAQDASEAAQFTECWDAVLSYADLCTAGTAAAPTLAREAFARGLRQVRDAEAVTRRAPGRRTARLPRIPLLLTAVRDTAADWEATGRGHDLDPDLRLWLNSPQAGRHTGRRALAPRALRDLQEADAELLWLAEVEALPLRALARRFGLDPAAAAEELDHVRVLFRDRCRRAHLDAPLDIECRRYAHLLDAVTRRPGIDTPDDLSRHLAVCPDCAEAVACLRLHGGTLPAALAGGVLGWGGLAYLERRRRAVEVRAGASQAEQPAEPDRTRRTRGGLLAAAGVVSLLALAVTLIPLGSDGDTAGARTADPGRRQAADALPAPTATSATPTPTTGAPHHPPATGTTPTAPSATAAHPSRTASPTGPENPDPEPQGTATATGTAAGPGTAAPAACTVHYSITNQWPDGFQAAVTVTTADALTDWHVDWSFRDGQRITQMWNAQATQSGPHVTADAADFDRTVSAGGTLSFGFLATWTDRNTHPYGFTLNGRACATR